jgi:hypothetical protein
VFRLNDSRIHQGSYVQQFSVHSTRNGNAVYEIDLNVRKDSKGTVETQVLHALLNVV